MTHRMSYEQATNALGHIEKSLQHLQLEAIFYAPTMYVLGMEMACKSDRGHMVNFAQKLRQKGFSITD